MIDIEWVVTKVSNLMCNFVYSGLLVTLTDYMKQSLNFSSTRVQPEDGFWGAVVVDKETNESSWTGMVRQLKDKEVDFCNAGMVVSGERQEVNKIKHFILLLV